MRLERRRPRLQLATATSAAMLSNHNRYSCFALMQAGMPAVKAGDFGSNYRNERESQTPRPTRSDPTHRIRAQVSLFHCDGERTSLDPRADTRACRDRHINNFSI